MVSYVAINLPPNLFWSLRYRVTRATGEDQVVKKNGGYPVTSGLSDLLQKALVYSSE